MWFQKEFHEVRTVGNYTCELHQIEKQTNAGLLFRYMNKSMRSWISAYLSRKFFYVFRIVTIQQ
jgi:hypothetical protein